MAAAAGEGGTRLDPVVSIHGEAADLVLAVVAEALVDLAVAAVSVPAEAVPAAAGKTREGVTAGDAEERQGIACQIKVGKKTIELLSFLNSYFYRRRNIYTIRERYLKNHLSSQFLKSCERLMLTTVSESSPVVGFNIIFIRLLDHECILWMEFMFTIY